MQGSHAMWSRAARLARFVRKGLVAGLVALLATTAAAQDYTVTSQTGQYVSPPTSGVSDVTSMRADDMTYTIDPLPFEIPYYGVGVNKITVCTNGYCFMNSVGYYTYGYSPVALPQSGQYDGIVKVAMTDGDGRGTNSRLKYWSDGTAPNRRFIITWENWTHYSISGNATFQVQFYESGRIQIAYNGTWTWGYSTGVGIDALSPDSRWAAPNNSSNYTFSGTPANDWRFEPDITKLSGRLMIEEIVTNASGYGAGTRAAAPLAGARVEIRSGSSTAGAGYTDADGYFEAGGVALDSTQSGSLVVVSGSRAAVVTPSSQNTDRGAMSAPYSTVIAPNIGFGSDDDIGTFTLRAATDSDGSARAPIQIAVAMDRIRDAAAQFTSTVIPPVDVFYSPNSASPTRYVPATLADLASIRIGGTTSTNPDAFDPAVIARLYMRHVLHAVTGSTTTDYAASLDAQQATAQAAFADGLGLMAHSALTGDRVVYDGTAAGTATSLDLETPTLTRSPGPTVSGWAGAAMYDLLDPANESFDTVDGTAGSNATRPFQTLAALRQAALPESFVDAWIAEGFPAGGLVTDFIHHGLLPDDANEPNDLLSQAKPLGVAGLRTVGLKLNRYNEDWFQVQVAQPAPVFFAEVAFNRAATGAQVALEVYRTDGTRIAVGVPDGPNGPIVATMQNVPAGTIVVRIAHEGGGKIDAYDLQVYAQMSVALSSAPAWTVSRRIQEPLDLRGGIPPYTVLAKDGAGELFTQIQFLPSQTTTPYDMVWTPQEVGNFVIQITATDAGVPAHTRTLNLNFRVNDVLGFSAPELTGVALNKAADVNLGRVGGTDPITLSDEFGDLPEGLTVDPDFHIRGTAAAPGGGEFGFHAEDVAGSEADVDSFLVVCVPIETKKQPVPMAAGQAAAGFYFDALAGSNCNFKLKTAKKQAKRDLNFLVIGPDGNAVQGGSAKIKAGSVALKSLGIPTTGRYFMAFASDDGGAETELQGTLSLKLPTKGATTIEGMELDGMYKVEFGALAGATLNVKGTTTEGMEIRVLFIIQPDGTVVPFDDIEVVNNRGKVTIQTAPLTQSGTHQLYLRPLKTDLADFKLKYKVKQPKGGVFVLDE